MNAQARTTGPASSRERWVFKVGQELFGPVPTEILEAKLRAGELGPETLVAREHGPFAPIGAVEPFVGIAAEVAAELAARRQRVAARKRRLRIGLGALVVVAGLGGAGWFVGMKQRATLEHRDLRSISIEVLPMAVRVVDLPAEGEELEWDAPPPTRRMGAPGRRGSSEAAPRMPVARTRGGQPADELAVETHFDASAIERVVARNRARLLPCIRSQAENDPTFRGELPLSFVVGNDGKVTRLWVDRVGYRSGSLHACLLEEIRRWEFPRFEGQSPAISLRFRVGG